MIAFLPHLRSGNAAAARIHAECGSDNRVFLNCAREFLRSHDAEASGAGPPPSRGEAGGLPDVSGLSLDRHGPAPASAAASPSMAVAPKQQQRAPGMFKPAPPGLPPGMRPAPPGLPGSPQHRQQQQQSYRGPGGSPPGVRLERLGANAAPVPMPVPLPATPVPATSSGPHPSPSPRQAPPTPAPAPASPAFGPKTPAKVPRWQPKRTRTRLSSQPGAIRANGVAATGAASPVLTVGTRRELSATWSLPLAHLRERAISRMGDGDDPASLTIRDALQHLTVGLFRRGCTENGEGASIVSKEIVTMKEIGTAGGGGGGGGQDRGGGRGGYSFQVRHDLNPPSVVGTVPFYTPRTPGSVVLRLYFEDDPVDTLASGPPIRVVTANVHDLESTLRFILSNFKSKQGTANFSGLHNFANVLGQFKPSEIDGDVAGRGGNRAHGRGGKGGGGGGDLSYIYDGAGRAAFGCLAESRRVVDYACSEYNKKKGKLALEEVETKKIIEELEAAEAADHNEPQRTEEMEGNNGEGSAVEEENALDIWRQTLKDVQHSQSLAERKWREMQSAFASILKNAYFNSSTSIILRRDVRTKCWLEYQLYCPFVEAFAPNPFGKAAWGIPKPPHAINQDHFAICRGARERMQKDVLGFIPRTDTLPNVFHRLPFERYGLDESRNPSDVVKALSDAILNVYDREYRVSPEVSQMRETCRREVEAAVKQCTDVFPMGTQVVVFGSCANGFGSPTSDLDMCLQLPQGASLATEDDESGAKAMGKIAEQLEEAGMENVDTARLTARIPVVMFNYPAIGPSGEKILLDCDLSMQNPLACLNTNLLLSYANISPLTRLLVSMIKRWAKNRDLNSPARHTLSSYGYILMLLYFLTHHADVWDLVNPHSDKRDGHILPFPGGDEKYKPKQPLLPNLQWMDQLYPQMGPDAVYSDMVEKPNNEYYLKPHPTEQTFTVNTYYYRIPNEQEKVKMQQKFAPDRQPAVAVVLAAFFRFFAYEFDCKKHVVSLNSAEHTGPVEKEEKAESDGWSLYRQNILAIEDPFETFYDVAHVLKPPTFLRLRREFAMAYSKLVDALTGAGGGDGVSSWGKDDIGAMSGEQIIDWLCEALPEVKE